MDNLVPQAPSDASNPILQDRFNRDVNTSIRQMKDEIETRLSKVEEDLAALIIEWEAFYDVEWVEYQEAAENRFLEIEAAIAALAAAIASMPTP